MKGKTGSRSGGLSYEERLKNDQNNESFKPGH